MNENYKDILKAISKGDTTLIEGFFKKKGSRRYLENITLILINTLPHPYKEKEEMYLEFVNLLYKIEKRIERQNEGQQIIKSCFVDNKN